MAVEYHGMEKWNRTSNLLRYAASKRLKAYTYAELDWLAEKLVVRPAPVYVMCDGVPWPVFSMSDIDEAVLS